MATAEELDARRELETEITEATPRSLDSTKFPYAEPDVSEPQLDAIMYSILQDPEDTPAKREQLQAYRGYRHSRGEDPFAYLEKGQRQERNQAFRRQIPFFDTLFSGPGNFTSAFPEGERPGIEEMFSVALDPDSDKRTTTNKLFYQAMTGEAPDDDLWAIQRTNYARGALGWGGPSVKVGGLTPEQWAGFDQTISDDDFYKLAGDRWRKEKSDSELSEQIADLGQYAAITTQPMGEAMVEAKKLAGDRWKEFEPAFRQAYGGVLRDFTDDELFAARVLAEAVAREEGTSIGSRQLPTSADQKAAPDRDTAVALFNERDDKIDRAMQIYGNADQASRDRITSLIGTQATKEGEDVENYFKRVRKSFGSVMEIMETGPDSFLGRTLLNIDVGEAKTEKDRQQDASLKGRADFIHDLRTAGARFQRFDDGRREGLWDTLGDYGVIAAGSLPVIMHAGAPFGRGMPYVAAGYGERNFAEMRRRNAGGDLGQMQALSYASGALEAGIDRLQWFTMGATLPKMNATLLQLGKPGAILYRAGQAGAIGAAETGQEVIQDLTAPVIENLAAAVSDDLNAPSMKKVLEEEWKALPDIAGVSLLFGIIGASGSAIGDYASTPAIKEALTDRTGLALAGYDKPTVDNIVQTAEKNPLAAAELLKAAQMETPVEVRKQNSEAARERLEAENAAADIAAAGLPVLEKLDDGRVLVRKPDGSESTVAGPVEAMEELRSWEAEEEITMSQGIREMVKHLEGYHEGNPELAARATLTGREMSFETWASGSKSRLDQAYARVRILLREEGLDVPANDSDIDLSQYLILGSSRNSYAAGVTRIAMEINRAEEGGRAGATVLTPIEEHAEGVGKWLMDTGRKSSDWMVQQIRETEANTNRRFIASNFAEMTPELQRQEIVESFSRIAVGNAMGRVQDSSLSAGLKAILRAIKETVHAILQLATDIKAFRDSGKMDTEFSYWLDVAAGLEDDYYGENLARAMEAEMEAAAFEGMPEIQDSLKGRIPHPDTLKAQGHPLVGEVRRIYEGIAGAAGSKSAGTRAANSYFLPSGEMADLDDVRERANRSGFSFATPGEMLDALDLSVNYGKRQYGFGESAFDEAADWEPSFSISSDLRTLFPNPPEAYTFTPSDEQRAEIREIAERASVALVASPDLSASARRVQEAVGVEVFFFKGHPELLGFTPQDRPELIFLNSAPTETGIPLAWTAAHEITHVSQKDTSAGATALHGQITGLLTPEEFTAFTGLLESWGYAKDAHETELTAFLVGDAISGDSVFGLADVERSAEITAAIEQFVDSLPVLKPARAVPTLESAPDSELARMQGETTLSIGVRPEFYSQLERTVEAKVPNNATPAQIMATVDPSRGSGVKAEEVKWSGLEGTLQRLAAENDGKVPKAALLEQLRNEGAVRFIETSNATDPALVAELKAEFDAAEQAEMVAHNAAMAALADAGAGRVEQINIVENLTIWRHVDEAATERATARADALIPDFDWNPALDATLERENAKARLDAAREGAPQYGEYQLPGGENYKEVVLSMPVRDGQSYTSSHFKGIPNYIGHYRTNERIDAAGDDILFVEEIQSDRHQQGREKGYRGETPTDEEVRRFFDLREDADPADYREEMMEHGDHRRDAVPDAPFRKDWPLQLFKRALRDAVASGKDAIGWVTGATPAERFDLSKQVSRINLREETGGTYHIVAFKDDSRGRRAASFNQGGVSKDKLGDYIGKEVAQKILAQEPNAEGIRVLEGDDLKIEAAGMKAFYDKILPSEIGKYVKKWGGKVTEGELPGQDAGGGFEIGPEGVIPKGSAGTPYWKVEITEAMRESVEAGQASFAIAKADSPLVAGIKGLIRQPEAKATVYKRMLKQVSKVRQRFDERRLRGDFSDTDFDPGRFEQIRDLALLEAMAKALPPALRGKIVGSFRKLEALKTAKGRENYMVNLLPKIEQAFEVQLQRTYRDMIRRTLKKGDVKVSEAKTRGGKISPHGHDVFALAKESMLIVDATDGSMTAAELAEEAMDKITAEIEASGEMTLERLDELDAKRAAISLFYDYANADSARLERAAEFLTDTYQQGREQWIETLKERKEIRTSRVEVFRKGMLVAGNISRGDNRFAMSKHETSAMEGFSEGIMAVGLSGSQTLRRLAELTKDPVVKEQVEQLELEAYSAEANESDRNAADDAALAKALQDILGAKTQYGIAKRLRDLMDVSKEAPVTTIEGRKEEEISVPIRFVEALVEGQTAGFERENGKRVDLDDADVAALAEEWEKFQDLTDAEQAKKRVIKFSRVTAKGKRKGLANWSKLGGLQLWLTMRQPDQAAKLERMGYDEQTMRELEAWLPQDVKDLGLWMVARIGADTFTIDQLHRSEKGVGLPLVDQYFPVRNDVARADNSGLAVNGQPPQQTGRSVTFTKQRVSNQAEPAHVNALAVFLQHRAQTNFWISHVTFMREWGGVIRDENFAQAVKYRMGEKYYSALTQLLKRIESGGSLRAHSLNDLEKLAKAMTSRFAAGVLGGRVSTLMVNTTAVLNSAWEIPADQLLKGSLLAAKRPEAFKDAWASPAIQRRLRDGATFEATLARRHGPGGRPTIALLDHWARLGLRPINYVDTTANMAGAAAVWEYTRTQSLAAGMTEEQAREAADRKTELVLLRAAQPQSRLARSELEFMALESPLSALFTLFVSEPRKNAAITYMALRELKTGKGTYGKKMAAQQAIVGLVLVMAAENIVRGFYQAWANAKDDEEDEVWARWWTRMTDAKAWGYKFSTQYLERVPLVGEVWNRAMASMFEQKAFPASQNPLNSAARTVEGFAKEWNDESPATMEEKIDLSIKGLQNFGPIVPGGPLAAQVGNVADFLEGITETEEEKIDRTVSRFNKFAKETDELYGKTMKPTGKLTKGGKPQLKVDDAVKVKKDRAKADWINSNLPSLPEDQRRKAMERINTNEAMRDMIE